MQTDAKSPGAVIGENLRSLREQAGKRQDDVAAAARDLGLRWSQATVGAIEIGRREVTVGELVLLPVILHKSLGVELAASDLLVAAASVRLGPDAVATGHFVAASFAGTASDVLPRELDAPWTRKAGKAAKALASALGSAELNERVEQLTALADRILGTTARMRDVGDAEIAAGQLVERRAAKVLDVDPMAVALAAHKLWGHGLTVERDRRTQGGSAKPRGAGVVTRQLIAELRPVLARAGLITGGLTHGNHQAP